MMAIFAHDNVQWCYGDGRRRSYICMGAMFRKSSGDMPNVTEAIFSHSNISQQKTLNELKKSGGLTWSGELFERE